MKRWKQGCLTLVSLALVALIIGWPLAASDLRTYIRTHVSAKQPALLDAGPIWIGSPCRLKQSHGFRVGCEGYGIVLALKGTSFSIPLLSVPAEP
jgi:hypothetical protein